MKISVVICTYRRPSLLAEALKSAVDQEFAVGEYEVIVVDNNSKDETPKIVGQIQDATNVPVRYEVETKKGLSHARNCGIRQSRGGIIAFLDDDAVADRRWITEILHVYDKYPRAWAVGGKIEPIWHGKRPDWLIDHYLRWLSLLDLGPDLRPVNWNNRIDRIIGANCSFQKKAFEQLGPFRTELGRIGESLVGDEDTELQERIHSAGYDVYYSPRAIVKHHVPEDRISKSYFRKRSAGAGETIALRSYRLKGLCGLARYTLWNFIMQFKETAMFLYYFITGNAKKKFEYDLYYFFLFGFYKRSILLVGSRMFGWLNRMSR